MIVVFVVLLCGGDEFATAVYDVAGQMIKVVVVWVYVRFGTYGVYTINSLGGEHFRLDGSRRDNNMQMMVSVTSVSTMVCK